MASSNGNIFCVTGPLCREFTGPGEFPTQRPVTRSFDVFFDLRLNKQLSKQPWGWWFETLSCPLWRHGYVWQTTVACRLISLLMISWLIMLASFWVWAQPMRRYIRYNVTSSLMGSANTQGDSTMCSNHDIMQIMTHNNEAFNMNNTLFTDSQYIIFKFYDESQSFINKDTSIEWIHRTHRIYILSFFSFSFIW